MSPGFDRFQTGMLFEWAADLGDVRLEVLAEVVVLEKELHLRDIAVLPAGTGRASLGAAGLLGALRRELIPQIRAEVSAGSGSPERGCRGRGLGVPWDITIGLTEDPR